MNYISPFKKRKIQKTLMETKTRRANMNCKVIECKIDKSTLSKTSLNYLHKLFLESKWLYNSILSSDNIADYDTKSKVVPVKVLDKTEIRNLEHISAQMKQGIKTRIFSSMTTLKALKEKGYKTGQLKFKAEFNSIPLKQHTQTFTILPKENKIKVQGIKQAFKVNGLDQLPESHEIANANLIQKAGNYYINVTIYTKKEKINVPDESIGIDFGCDTQLTLSNGKKIKFLVPDNDKVKSLSHQLSRKTKRSKRYQKCKVKREKAYLHLVNKRKDIKNKIVSKLTKSYRTICFQDEQLNSWKQNGHGKKIQYSALGGIITALKHKAVTPVVLDKYYPSTKTCSKCGNKQDISIRERTYICKQCGQEIDRDLNSALNMLNEGVRIRKEIPTERREIQASSSGESRCEERLEYKLVEKPSSVIGNYSKIDSVKRETAQPLG